MDKGLREEVEDDDGGEETLVRNVKISSKQQQRKRLGLRGRGRDK